MRIPIYFGITRLGLLEREHGYVATRFVHVYFIPLFPIGGVVGQRDYSGGLVESAGPLSGWSVLVGYIKVWGFLLACGAGFGAYELLSWPSTPAPLAILAAFASAGTMGLVTLSWLFLGRRNAQPSTAGICLALFFPLLLLVAFGLGLARREERSHWAEFRKSDPPITRTGPGVTTATTPDPVLVANIRRVEHLHTQLNTILRVAYAAEQKGWLAAPCAKGSLPLASSSPSAKQALHSDYKYLFALHESIGRSAPRPTEVMPSRWLTSDPLVALARKPRKDVAPELDQIDARPYLALYMIASSTLPKRVGAKWTPGRIAAHVIVFDLKTANAMCTSGPILAEYVPKGTKVDNDAAGKTLGDLFTASAARTLPKVAPDLTFDFDH